MGREQVAIRMASDGDREAVERLAQLDSAGAAHGATLVAEVDGRISAALPLAGGPAMADPFEPTAELVSLLELRAQQLGAEPRRPRAAGALPRHLRALPLWRHA